MSDPLSVTASAAGLISLGLETCKGIVKYCDAWRGSDEEIANLTTKAEGLSKTLKHLDRILIETDQIDPEIASDISAKIVANRSWITKLNEKISKCVATSQDNGRIQTTARKAMYPFRRDTLLGMKDILHGLQMNLHTAFLAAQLQQVSALAKQEESIKKIEIINAMILAKIDKFGTEINQMALPFPPQAQPSSYAVQSRTRRCPDTTCLCPQQLDTIYQIHIPSCLFYKSPLSTRVLTKKFTFCSQWLGLSVKAAISFAKGSSGLSISPLLQFQAIVPHDSGAFGIVSRPPPLNEKPEAVARFYDYMIHNLQQLFDERKASPTDRERNGMTLLHAACRIWHNNSLRNPFVPMHQARVIRYLARAGCPINEVSSSGLTALDHLVQFRIDATVKCLIFDLIDSGGLITSRGVIGINLQGMKYYFSKKNEGFLLPNIATAILSHSEADLRNLLDSGCADPNDLVNEATLIQMSADWPKGLRILLEAGADIKSPDSRALSLAIKYDLLDSAKVLVHRYGDNSHRDVGLQATTAPKACPKDVIEA
ncbi:hypothetical protein MW887_006577 [Aspergillus wentii]|nr:hypothetical protein MW887_006577 [Aspergillus wentii]